MDIARHLFGSTGWTVSCLGFGGAPMAYLKTERQRISQLLNKLLDEGVNLIDTAAMYPGSEEAIGATIGHRRNEYLLVTKCGNKAPDINEQPWSAALIGKTIDRSLKLLRTEVIDVALLHSCDLATLKKGEAIGALLEAQAAGKIRWAGYSGDNEAAAYAANLKQIAVIQMSVNIADQANLDMVLPICREKNIAVIAKRPIANAAWKEMSDQRGVYANYAREYHERLLKMNLAPVEMGIKGPPEKAWPELALRFTLSVPGVHCAIVGTTNPNNAQANLEIAARGELPREKVEKIRELFTRAKGEQHWPALQ
ncbi:MAG TPA: aldo/keto reductase [Tepidisphaeraceae bacterium]|nr:aldo/keto reductase [Tepidisphaeraceae bacterium]